MKTFRRIVIAVLTAAVVTTIPVGVASAHDRGSSSSNQSSITLTTEQRAAILTARGAYLDAAASARATYRNAVDPIVTGIRTQVEPAELAVEKAKDALAFTAATGGDTAAARAALDAAIAAYKAAVATARATAQPQLDAAKAAATASLTTAANTYRAAVTAAFPAGTVIPERLLVPPGTRGHDKGMHGFGGMHDQGDDRRSDSGRRGFGR